MLTWFKIELKYGLAESFQIQNDFTKYFIKKTWPCAIFKECSFNIHDSKSLIKSNIFPYTCFLIPSSEYPVPSNEDGVFSPGPRFLSEVHAHQCKCPNGAVEF